MMDTVAVVEKRFPLEAMEHDGTLDSAKKISRWLMVLGAVRSEVFGAYNTVYFFADEGMYRQTVLHDWWVVSTRDKTIVAMSDDEFRKRYEMAASPAEMAH